MGQGAQSDVCRVLEGPTSTCGDTNISTVDPLFVHPASIGVRSIRRPAEPKIVPRWAVVVVLLVAIVSTASVLFTSWVSNVTDRSPAAADCVASDRPLASYRSRTEAIASGETQVAGVVLCR